MLIGKARYRCPCMVRYAETSDEDSDNPNPTDNRWLIVGLSVGFGVLLILTVVVVVLVSCCGRRSNHHHRQESSAEETCHYAAGFMELDNSAMAVADKEHYSSLGEPEATGKAYMT